MTAQIGIDRFGNVWNQFVSHQQAQKSRQSCQVGKSAKWSILLAQGGFTLSSNTERVMTGSEANRQRVLSLVITEREQILEQYGYIDTKSTAVRRGKPPMSESKQLSFYDCRDRIQSNDL